MNERPCSQFACGAGGKDRESPAEPSDPWFFMHVFRALLQGNRLAGFATLQWCLGQSGDFEFTKKKEPQEPRGLQEQWMWNPKRTVGGNSNFEIPILKCQCDTMSGCYNWDRELERNLKDCHVPLSVNQVSTWRQPWTYEQEGRGKITDSAASLAVSGAGFHWW